MNLPGNEIRRPREYQLQKKKRKKGKRAYCVGKLHVISAWQEGQALCEGLEVKSQMTRFLNVML